MEEAEIEVEWLGLGLGLGLGSGTKVMVQLAHRKVRGYPVSCPFWVHVLLS